MKICQKCNLNYENEKFCAKCGQALQEINVENAPTEHMENVLDTGKAVVQTAEDLVVSNEKREWIIDVVSKPKKKRWGLYIAGITLTIFFLLIGGILYYLGHSEIIGNSSRSGRSEKFSLEEMITEAIVGENIDFKLDYKDLNYLLKYGIKLDDISVLGFFQTEDVYFDGREERVIFSVSSPLGYTSLLLKPEIEINEKKIKISLASPALGNWKIPLPQKLFEKAELSREIDVSEVFFAKIDSVDFLPNHLQVKGKIQTDKLDQLFLEIVEQSDAFMLQFLMQEKSKELPAYQDILEYKDKKAWKSILIAWFSKAVEVPNWLYLVDEKVMDDYFKFQTVIMGEEINKKTIKQKAEVLSQRTVVEKEYKDYKAEKLSKQLVDDAATIFYRLYSYHEGKGVPAYYLASKGKLYSQTLKEYIGTYGLKPDSDLRWDAYELYAYGKEAVFGINVDKDFWYVKESDKSKILKKPKEEFLEGIKYSPELSNGNLLLTRGNADRSAIARVVSASLGTAQREDIFIQYLASDGQFAFLIASPDYARQQPEQYFLQKLNGQWQIMRKFTENQSIRQELSNEINSQNFNVCILPPYETKDFQRNYLSSYDLNSYEWSYYYETGYDKVVNYYSSVGGNTVITFDADSKFLYADGQKIYMPRGDKVENYYKYLTPHRDYPNYRPIHIFYQD